MADMPTDSSDRWIWLRLPLVPFVIAGGFLFVAVLVVLQLLALPWMILYPEWQRHVYDFGTERQQEAIHRWRLHCRRVSFIQRLRNLWDLFRRRS